MLWILFFTQVLNFEYEFEFERPTLPGFTTVGISKCLSRPDPLLWLIRVWNRQMPLEARSPVLVNKGLE